MCAHTAEHASVKVRDVCGNVSACIHLCAFPHSFHFGTCIWWSINLPEAPSEYLKYTDDLFYSWMQTKQKQPRQDLHLFFLTIFNGLNRYF